MNTSKGLSKRDQEMVKLYVSDPKITKTEAWKRTHNTKTTNQSSIYQQAAHTFNTPQVKMEIAKYNDRVEQVLFNTMDEWGEHEKPRQREIAIDTAKYLHDKIHGRAVQQIQTTSNSISFNIDLTMPSTDEEHVAQ